MPPSCALLGGIAIGARDAFLWQHYRNAWQSPAVVVIRQAQRKPHALRTHAPAIKSTRLLRVRRYLQRGRSISSILRGCCNANVKCYRVHACTRSMPGFMCDKKLRVVLCPPLHQILVTPLTAESHGVCECGVQFYEFDQTEFFYFSSPAASSMDDVGYAYVPSGCKSGSTSTYIPVMNELFESTSCEQGQKCLERLLAARAGFGSAQTVQRPLFRDDPDKPVPERLNQSGFS